MSDEKEDAPEASTDEVKADSENETVETEAAAETPAEDATEDAEEEGEEAPEGEPEGPSAA